MHAVVEAGVFSGNRESLKGRVVVSSSSTAFVRFPCLFFGLFRLICCPDTQPANAAVLSLVTVRAC